VGYERRSKSFSGPDLRSSSSLDPFALRTAFPPSLVGRYSHDHYESSATPRRQQRTVHLLRTPKEFGGHRRERFPRSLIRPVARVGARLYPGGIAAVHRNTARGVDRPNDNRSAETVLMGKQDRAPRQPIAASFGAAVLYRGF
jgi:hypothetical protein